MDRGHDIIIFNKTIIEMEREGRMLWKSNERGNRASVEKTRPSTVISTDRIDYRVPPSLFLSLFTRNMMAMDLSPIEPNAILNCNWSIRLCVVYKGSNSG